MLTCFDLVLLSSFWSHFKIIMFHYLHLKSIKLSVYSFHTKVYFTHVCYLTFWALEHLLIEQIFLENYSIFSKSILWQLSCVPSSFQHKLNFTFQCLFQHKLFKKKKLQRIYPGILLWCTAYNLRTFTWNVKLIFRLRGSEHIHTEG